LFLVLCVIWLAGFMVGVLGRFDLVLGGYTFGFWVFSLGLVFVCWFIDWFVWNLGFGNSVICVVLGFLGCYNIVLIWDLIRFYVWFGWFWFCLVGGVLFLCLCVVMYIVVFTWFVVCGLFGGFVCFCWVFDFVVVECYVYLCLVWFGLCLFVMFG